MKTKHLSVGGLVALLLTAVSGLVLPGCSGSTVMPTTAHAPTNPATVNLYQKPPTRYEILGTLMLPVTPEMKWDESGNSTAGFDALKAKAAATGANGVLLVAPAGMADGAAVVGYRDEHYQVPMKSQPRTAIAQAIFVHPE